MPPATLLEGGPLVCATTRAPFCPEPAPFLPPNNENLNSVMDYASGGSLLEYVQQRKRLREPVARWFFQQLVLAVDYCHRKVRARIDQSLTGV